MTVPDKTIMKAITMQRTKGVLLKHDDSSVDVPVICMSTYKSTVSDTF